MFGKIHACAPSLYKCSHVSLNFKTFHANPRMGAPSLETDGAIARIFVHEYRKSQILPIAHLHVCGALLSPQN